MKIRLMALTLTLLFSAGCVSAQEQQGEAHAIVALPDGIEWAQGPPSLPPGAEFAVLEGDPAEEGPFTMRLWMPDGYRIPPHVHPVDERVTVISGTFAVGMGEEFDVSEAIDLPAGTYAALAPNTPHFAIARGETVIQLNNIGPWSINYVNPEDDPRNGRED
ncbi:MAG: cupin domain-containing protein [Longimicrobiaceae bacterium]